MQPKENNREAWLWLGLVGAICGLAGIYLIIQRPNRKEAFTCAICRENKWHFYNSFSPTLDTESLKSSVCSHYVFEHESSAHVHAWVKSQDIWFLSLTGETIGGGSRDASLIWYFTEADQLAVYQKCDSVESRKAAYHFFAKFSERQKDKAYQRTLLEKAQKLSAHSQLTDNDFNMNDE